MEEIGPCSIFLTIAGYLQFSKGYNLHYHNFFPFLLSLFGFIFKTRIHGMWEYRHIVAFLNILIKQVKQGQVDQTP